MAWLRWNASSPENAKAAERGLIERAGVECKYQDTLVGTTNEESMHSISAGSTGVPVVMMPGYAAGAAFFFRNIQGLSSKTRLFLVDWLGTGLSGRPPFECKTREETEAWFVESLDNWREAQGLDQMVLVGHSLGGYLSACYAVAHPERVKHLVLVCPAGMVGKPDDYEIPDEIKSPLSIRGAFYRLVVAGWNRGVTPGVMARTLGPLSRRVTHNYTQRRLHSSLGIPQDVAEAFEPYIFEILGAKGSGEFALRHILEPMAWAKAPFEKRAASITCPLTFIYGENDWMDPEAGQRICDVLRKSHSEVPTAKKLRPRQNECLVIKNSGHHTYLESPDEFNKILLEIAVP